MRRASAIRLTLLARLSALPVHQGGTARPQPRADRAWPTAPGAAVLLIVVAPRRARRAAWIVHGHLHSVANIVPSSAPAGRRRTFSALAGAQRDHPTVHPRVRPGDVGTEPRTTARLGGLAGVQGCLTSCLGSAVWPRFLVPQASVTAAACHGGSYLHAPHLAAGPAPGPCGCCFTAATVAVSCRSCAACSPSPRLRTSR